MNLIARIFGNGLFLLDFHNVIQLEHWRTQHAAQLPQWMDSLAEWDSLLAFATLHYNHPHYAFAETSESLSILGEEIAHPLLPAAVRLVPTYFFDPCVAGITPNTVKLKLFFCMIIH